MIRLLTLDDLEQYLDLCAQTGAESGRDGDGYHGPYGRAEPFLVDSMRERTRERWSKSLDVPGWRRAWGAFADDVMIGCGDVAGGDIAADLHRVDLGIAVLRRHRRGGHGGRLLAEIIRWCRVQPSIAWLDLGVFADNTGAQALFDRAGFQRRGVSVDRWRVDGVRLDEIAMSLDVGSSDCDEG